MSEPKRVALTSINVQKNKNEKKSVNRSFRFNLTLTESNEKSCPIFNYRELLESAAEKNKPKPVTNGLDPFGDDNDEADVARIARQFEAKYGCPTPSKKKKKKYKGDWADMGAGYDESDSFIDNTDAYDEIVPEDIIPEHGGFYINSGSLEYKQQEISEMEDISSSRSTVQKNRKRMITSEDSDDENEKSVKAEKRPRVDSDGEKSTIKKLDNNNVNIIPVKKKPSSITDSNGVKKKPTATTVKELLKEKRDDLDVISSSGGDNKQLPKEIVNINSENKKTVLKSTSINDAIESVISAAAGSGARTTIENNSIQNQDESSKDSTSSESSSSDSSDNSECTDSSDDEIAFKNNDNQTNSNNVAEIIKLPDNLTDETLKLIDSMKMASQNAEGKVKFFSESVNKMLLRLHILCGSLKSSVRSQVYAHLAAFVKCKKDTLIRRTKKLILDQAKTSIDDSLARLKECIDRTMPTVIENYTKECQRINEKNTLYHLEMYRCFRLSQDRADSPNGDKPKTLRLPKRKFPWTDQTRKIIGEIISKKRECFNIEKNRKKRFDQYLENYYRDKMVILWPDGWMSAAYLIRESLQFFTKEERGPKLDKKENSNKEIKIVLNSGNNPLSSKNIDGKSQKVLPKVHSDSSNVPTKLPVPIGPPSLSIKAVSQNDTVKNSIKNMPTNSGITIEPIMNKVNEKRKTASPMPTDLTVNNSNLSAATLDSITTALKQQGITVENSKKSNSRNASPIPPTNPLDLNTKGSIKPKTDVGISVRKLSELVPNDSTNNNNSTKKQSKESSDSDIEIIEIQDDDLSIQNSKKNSDQNPQHASLKSKTSENTEKVRHKSKKKPKIDTINRTKAQLISQLMKEKTLQIKDATTLSSSKPPSNSTTGSDLITKLITDSLAVSVSRKPQEESKSVSNNDPVSNLNDVMQVMKDLQELHELTGRSSDKSRDSNDILRNSSPVSVIAVNSSGNNRHTPSAATVAAVAAVKNNSNLTISATSSMSQMQSQTAQHTGPAQKSPPY